MKISLFFSLLFWLSITSCDRGQKSSRDIQINEALVLNTLNTYMDSCWNKGDISNLTEISTEDFIRNLNGVTVATSQNEMKAHMALFFKGFPDMAVKLDSTIVKDNAIFTHWTSSGTHTGTFGEIAATGKKVKINGLSQFYFDSKGRLIREDVVFNELDLLQQMGYTLNPPVME